MLAYEKIDISEGIDVNKLKNSKECRMCYLWYFTDRNFSYGTYLCNGCYDMSMKAVSITNLAIIYSEGNAYRVNFAFMSINNVTKIMDSSNLNNKGVL